METTNGGATWTTYTTSYNSEFLSVKKVEDYLFITGTNGIILKTNLLMLGGLESKEDIPLSINIYPNPIINNSSINVIASKPGQYTIEIFDITGIKCFVKKFSLHTELNLSSTGVHLVKISNKQSLQLTKKLIIKN